MNPLPLDVPEVDPSDASHIEMDDGAGNLAPPSLDRFAAELSAMIEVAATTADALNRRVHEIGEGEHRAAAASTQLQEQLRLGARMLKAFQSQISRVESTLAGHQAYEKQIEETQTRIEQVFAGIESCVDKTIESVAYRLAEQARIAVERFDQGIAARQTKLTEIDARMTECAQGINGICEMVEQVQASVDSAVGSNQATLEQLASTAAEARRLLTQHEQARKSLASDLNAVRDDIISIERTGKDASDGLRDAIALSARAEAALRQRFSELESASRDCDRMSNTVAELRDLLNRLQPWEKLLLSGSINADGLPEPLARVAGEVKQQISQDMNWLSLTMREVAERVSNLASATPVASPPAATPAPNVEAEPAPDVHVNVKKPLRLRTFGTGA
jgi:chromosome segregation ATPase